MQTTPDRLPPRPPRPPPAVIPQGALPQSVTSAWPPRWGRRCGEGASPRSRSPASTAAGRCGRGAEEDAKPQCRIHTGFFLRRKHSLCPTISPLKEKKDLSTKASVRVSPISSILTPMPPRGGSGRSQPRTGTPAGRRRAEPPPQRPAEGSDRRDSDRGRPRRGSQPRRAAPAKTSQFPPRLRARIGGRTDGRGATLVPTTGLTCRWDPSLS